MTDQEINEAVAQSFGWKGLHEPKCRDGCFRCYFRIPDYCHSIAAAWEIVEFCKKIGPIDLDGDEDGFRFFVFNVQGPDHFGIADTAPMAICLAFLKLRESTKNQKEP